MTFKQLIFFQRPGLQTQIGIFGLNGTGLGFKKENLFWPAWDTDLTIVMIEQVFYCKFGNRVCAFLSVNMYIIPVEFTYKDVWTDSKLCSITHLEMG